MSNKPTSTKARIEVFRSGTFTPMSGDPISYGADDLENIVTNYSFDTAPAPIVVGHPKTDTPAFGWIAGFEYDKETDRLYADLDQIDPTFAGQVNAGQYKKVSMSFFKPDAPNNPTPGNWYPKHLGFLGATAPAVSGLKNASFAGAEDEVLTFVASFGETGFEDTSKLLRGLRDFMIEKFGLEVADDVLPSYRLDWLADTTLDIKPELDANHEASPLSSYSEPTLEEPDMSEQERAAFEKDRKKLKADQDAFAEKQKADRAKDNAAFAEQLVSDGKLLPASKDKVVTFLGELPTDQDFSFSEGSDATTLADAFKSILADQPKAVEFGATNVGDDLNETTSSFAADGKQVATDQLAIDAKATTYMSEHPGTDYITAVQAVS